MNPELTFLYVQGQEIGYGRMGVYIAKHLAERGVTVYDDHGDPTDTRSVQEGLRAGRKIASSPTNLACWASVPSHMVGAWEGQHTAFITMWEAMSLPESFREMFHEIDTMIVPSEQNVELFSRYHDNVHHMPLGVDPELWHYIPPTPPSHEFNFLINGRGTRKGVDLAFRAFREVFHGVGTGPTPRLIMKSLKGHGEYYAADVEHVTGKLDPIAERDLYARAHCYLGPSRGEGFGLAPLQAIALGRPTILTDAHGQAGYAHLGLGIDATPATAEYFIYGDAGDWWEPAYDELCEQMWDVYKNYATHAARAKESAEIVAHEWTWEQTTDRFVEILGPEMAKPYTGSGAWVPSTVHVFRIVTKFDWSCDIAGRHLAFRRGEEYWEPADVKRNLFDAGILDPICINEDDSGLAPQQVEERGLYRAANEHCLSCGQQLDGSPTEVDLIELEMLREEVAQLQHENRELRAARV